MSNSALVRSNIAALLVLLFALETGCRVWIEKPVQPNTNLRIGRHRQVRVITNTGDTVIMRAVAFREDSLVGLDSRENVVAIVRDSVKSIAVRMDGTPTPVRIGGKVYLGVVLALELALIVSGIAYGIAATNAR